MVWYNPLTWLDRAQAVRRWTSVLNELDKLRARVDALEVQMKQRPGPEFCPQCAAELRVVKVTPLVHHIDSAQFGERRSLKCTNETCDFERKRDVEFSRTA